MKQRDVLVRGAGIVGRSLALALGHLGLQVTLQAQSTPPGAANDVRAYALNAASVSLLRELKVWDAMPMHAATAVRDMRIEGDVPGVELAFSAWQQQVAELAFIVDAGAIEAALDDALKYAPHVSRSARADDGPAGSAALTALCEGQHSASRAALGVPLDRHAYGHRAIAAHLVSDRPHQGRAWQWFRSPDVLALLPFDAAKPGQGYALVWSMPDAQAAALSGLDDEAFAERLADATGGEAGALRLVSPRVGWPLSRARSEAWCGPGWVLLGDAAHVVHPLAGQGLNLGLADVAALTRVIAEREPWRGLGDERLLRRYARERAAPTWAMTQLTDGLLELFAHTHPAVRALRNRGMGLVNRLGPAKRWLAGRALGH